MFLILVDYMAELIMKCIQSRVTTGNMTVHLQVTYALYIGFEDVSMLDLLILPRMYSLTNFVLLFVDGELRNCVTCGIYEYLAG
jgi:hypothetical protein